MNSEHHQAPSTGDENDDVGLEFDPDAVKKSIDAAIDRIEETPLKDAFKADFKDTLFKVRAQVVDVEKITSNVAEIRRYILDPVVRVIRRTQAESRRGVYVGIIGTVLAFAALGLQIGGSWAARVLNTPDSGSRDLVDLFDPGPSADQIRLDVVDIRNEAESLLENFVDSTRTQDAALRILRNVSQLTARNRTHITNRPDIRAQLFYSAVLCRVALGDWGDVQQILDRAFVDGLERTSYWPALSIYQAEADARAISVTAGLTAYTTLSDWLSDRGGVNTMTIVSPDRVTRESISAIVDRRVRALRFRSNVADRTFWVVDSRDSTRHEEKAGVLRSIGAHAEARSGGWSVQFADPYVYVRDTTLLTGDFIVDLRDLLEIGNLYIQHWSTSRGAQIRALFADTETLDFLLIL